MLILYKDLATYFCGIPFNLVAAGLLLTMVATVCQLEPDEIIYNIADTHIYKNHLDAFAKQFTQQSYKLPKLIINKKITNINDFTFQDFELVDYVSAEVIKAEVAI